MANSFTIEHPSSGDYNEIVSLLRISLGESLMPKSLPYFEWKHIENPFGQSIILAAKSEGKIVGFRSLMRWKWIMKDQVVSAVRAVDTATHPDWQGKGIFKTLTLSALQEAARSGGQLVFNTPNPISKAGYIKMGWEEAGRLPLAVQVPIRFPALFSSQQVEAHYRKYSRSALTQCQLPTLFSTSWETPLSVDYLQWRYGTCPVSDYGVCVDDLFGIVFRLKPVKQWIELRICECWQSSHPQAMAACRRALQQLVQEIRPAVITSSRATLKQGLSLNWGFRLGRFVRGPEVTVRKVDEWPLSDFIDFKNWSPSLGAMELF